MRITDSIRVAGGLADFAKINRITLIRRDDRYIFNYAAYKHQEDQSNLLLSTYIMRSLPDLAKTFSLLGMLTVRG